MIKSFGGKLGIGFMFFLLSVGIIYSQNEESKWTAGYSLAMVKFNDEDAKIIGENFNFQTTKINVSRYFSKGLILDAGFSLSLIDRIEGFYGNAFSYFSIDGAIRYDFNNSNENFVPYIGIGGSLVGAPSTIPGSKLTNTYNFISGATFWFHQHIGMNTQFTYKLSPAEYQSMKSHAQVSVGFVYSFGSRVLERRLWDRD
ncbi:hypothetical protein OD91_1438 [Lutibacter sp. Hel_I_33_5]|uniref:porin family protein n=1 Tax=Lutibacter sp. Hel_I_33_5 TaxID=1566289 RepID=UPI0011A8C352|nr:porin family protein [Lutibacter sp. Hel_I_33_5]TVZ56158.1 hypothetical protein OD91_1438 [Lutibacter sp. Hel_I_33_5]